MDVRSVKINCYIEGIRIPVFNIQIALNRNTLKTAHITIPLGSNIKPIMWANAFVQLTYQEKQKEKLLFDGLCTDLNILEDRGTMDLTLTSKWDVLNFNSTLDYVSPKKYGLQKLDEGLRIWVGSESYTSVANAEFGVGTGSSLSSRYYWLQEEVEDISPTDSESHKIEYILNRVPSAQRIGFALFDDIVYSNFFLSRVYLDRFNLLAKASSSRTAKDLATINELTRSTTGFAIQRDSSRSGIAYLTDTHEIDTSTSKDLSKLGSGTFNGRPHGLEAVKQSFGEADPNGGNIEQIMTYCGKGGAMSSIRMHKNLKNIVLASFNEINSLGYGKYITSGAIGYVYRTKNPTNGAGSNQLSSHSWGIAFDVNTDQRGAWSAESSPELDKLAEVFQKHGWYWGKAFSDAMHFQFCTGY